MGFHFQLRLFMALRDFYLFDSLSSISSFMRPRFMISISTIRHVIRQPFNSLCVGSCSPRLASQLRRFCIAVTSRVFPRTATWLRRSLHFTHILFVLRHLRSHPPLSCCAQTLHCAPRSTFGSAPLRIYEPKARRETSRALVHVHFPSSDTNFARNFKRNQRTLCDICEELWLVQRSARAPWKMLKTSYSGLTHPRLSIRNGAAIGARSRSAPEKGFPLR